MRNGVKGYVTAGHVCKKVGDEISYNGTVIGTVKEHHFYQNSIADCGFIESNGAAYTSGAVMGGYYIDAVAEYPVNTVIYMYGKKSGLQNGKICKCNHTYTPPGPNPITVIDHVGADYKSQGGDSGAPVFVYTGWKNGRYTCTLIGIHTAGQHDTKFVGSVFCKYGNIAKKLGITAITD